MGLVVHMASYTALAPILIALVTDIGPLLQPLALQFVYFNGKSFVKGAVNVVFCIQESVKYCFFVNVASYWSGGCHSPTILAQQQHRTQKLPIHARGFTQRLKLQQRQ